MKIKTYEETGNLDDKQKKQTRKRRPHGRRKTLATSAKDFEGSGLSTQERETEGTARQRRTITDIPEILLDTSGSDFHKTYPCGQTKSSGGESKMKTRQARSSGRGSGTPRSTYFFV